MKEDKSIHHSNWLLQCLWIVSLSYYWHRDREYCLDRLIENDCCAPRWFSVQFCLSSVHRLLLLSRQTPSWAEWDRWWQRSRPGWVTLASGIWWAPPWWRRWWGRLQRQSIPPVEQGSHILFQVIYNLFHISCLCLLPIHVWIRDLRRLGNPDLLLGAGALRPAALLLLLLQLLRHRQLVGFTVFHKYRAPVLGGPQVAKMLQASWGRSGKQ